MYVISIYGGYLYYVDTKNDTKDISKATRFKTYDRAHKVAQQFVGTNISKVVKVDEQKR